MSLPAPPSIVSAPWNVMESLPVPPLIESAPPAPSIVSPKFDPVIVLAPVEPFSDEAVVRALASIFSKFETDVVMPVPEICEAPERSTA